MEARSRIGPESLSVLVASDGPTDEATVGPIGAEAFRRAFAATSGDTPTRLRAGLASAVGRPPSGWVPRSFGPRSLRSARGAVHAPVGVGAVFVDRDTAWFATRGGVDAFLVRDARIARIGPPTDGPGGDGVARVPLIPGDTLVLAARDLTRELGTDELRSAALTLHPDAAAAHLRRQFTTSGGRGSAAALVVDAGVAATRGHSLGSSARPAHGAAAARPSTDTPVRGAALGLASFVSVITIVALLVAVLPSGAERVAAQHGSLAAAVVSATDRATRAANVATSDPAEAIGLYLAAWDALEGAASPQTLADAGVADLGTRILTGLDAIRGGGVPEIRPIMTLEPGDGEPEVGAFVRGPGDDLYLIDRVASVVARIDPDDGERVDVVHRGDRATGGEARISRPIQLERAGNALLIVDDDARLWRWQPSDDDRDGKLTTLDLRADDEWSPSIGDVATYPDPFGFRVYLVKPSERNILRFQPMPDGLTFTRSDYLVLDDEVVGSFRQLYVDGRVFALADEGIHRYEFGRVEQFRIGVPPDDTDIRPGHDYRLIAGSDRNGVQGHLYVYDAAWDRIVVFDKVDGAYVRQWVPAAGDGRMDEVLGLSVTTGERKRPDTLHWLTRTGIYEAVVPWMAAEPRGSDEESGSRREGRRKARSR